MILEAVILRSVCCGDYNFDILKIDMSFVRKIETNTKTRSILRFLIDMAHEMGVSLIAEGAETQAQTAFLREKRL